MSESEIANLKFGDYQAIRELGRGATSIVYLAEKVFERAAVQENESDGSFPDLNVEQDKPKPAQAAVKVVNFNDETTKLSRRFRKLFATEAWVASQLDHPNITKVFDWKVEEDRAYLVMEHLEGKTLDAYVTMDKLLPVQKVVDIMHKVAVALDYAHRRGVVNRDIKPANVMLCENGDVKVMDFGLALNTKKNVDIDSTYINGLGSPAYMSPEQIKGYTLNHQTDLYSLGVMFYQLLSGRLPFRAKNTASLVYKIINTEPVPVTQLNPDLPEFTHNVISKAMEKDLYSRYRLGAHLAKDLSDAPYQRVKLDPSINLDARWKVLRALPLLGKLDDMDVWELLRVSNWREYPPAKVIMQEGEEGNSFGIVLEGHVEIENGAKALTIASKGDLIGITEWLDSEPDVKRTSTATTLDKVTYLEVNPAAFLYATEELSEEMHRLATDTVLRRMRRVIQLAKQVSPPAIHPAREAPVEAVPEVMDVPKAAPEKPLGWGAFAAVDANTLTVPPPAAEPQRVPLQAVPSAPKGRPAAPAVATPPPTLPAAQVPQAPAAPKAPARPAVLVQPMPAAAAAAITALALGGSGAAAGAPGRFDLGPATGGAEDFPPLIPEEERTLQEPPEPKPVSQMAADDMLTSEMAPRFSATTAFSTVEMAPNFMSTTAMDDAGANSSRSPHELEPEELMPAFDVHQGSATSEMAPNFAGTTAFSSAELGPPTMPDEPGGSFASSLLTTEMAPSFSATTAFTHAHLEPAPVPNEDLMPASSLLTTELAPDFAGTTAFESLERPPEPAPPARPVAPPPKQKKIPAFDPDKTVMLEGGFESEFEAEAESGFTEELFPAVPSTTASASAFGLPPAAPPKPVKPPAHVLPQEFDMDKTVEISGGFEANPVEDEAPLDDLFPPIKF